MALIHDKIITPSEGYLRHIITFLIQKATLKNVKFELNLGNIKFGKFSGCSIYLEEPAKWYFIQANESQSMENLTEDMLFPTTDYLKKNGEFSLFKCFKSYCDIKDYWRNGENMQYFVLFTNSNLDSSVNSLSIEFNNFFQMSNSIEFHTFQPHEPTLNSFVRYTKRDLKDIREAIIALFNGGKIKQILKDYKAPLSQMFSLRYGKVKFAEDFCEYNKDVRLNKLYNLLKEDFESQNKDIATVTVDTANMEDFWTITSSHLVLPPVIDRATVDQFFKDLVLVSSQPSVEELLKEINNEWRLWMLSWIKRDDYEKLTSNQLEQPYHIFTSAFQEWENRTIVSQERKLLRFQDGKRFLKKVECQLDDFICNLRTFADLANVEENYIHRHMVYEQNNLRHKDSDFVDQLYTTFRDDKFFLLQADSGEGKTTLYRYLAFYAQHKFLDSAVFLILLNKLIQTSLTDCSKLDDLLRISEENLSEKNMEIFENNSRKVLLFFDAFDGMSDENEKVVILIIRSLLDRDNVKIFINSRHGFKKKFDIVEIELIQFDENDQIDFLLMFWNISKNDRSKFENFTQTLIHKLHQDIKPQLFKLIGLPQMLRVFGEWYEDLGIKFRLEDKYTFELSDKVSEVDLYNNYINQSIEKAVIDNESEISDDDNLRDYQLLSAQTLIPEKILSKIIPREQSCQSYLLKCLQRNGSHSEFMELTKNAPEIIRELVNKHQESNVLKILDGWPTFTHSSYAAFLCANFIIENILYFNLSNDCFQMFVDFFQACKLVRVFFFAIVELNPKKELLKFIRKLGCRAAFWACKGDCLNVVNYLKNVFNYKKIMYDNADQTMLHVAVKYNSLKTLEVLFNMNVDVNCFSYSSYSPLYIACQNGYFEIVQALLSRGAKKDTDYGSNKCTVLHCAAEQGSVDIVRCLTNSYYKIDIENGNGETALQLAVRHNNIDAAKLLISRGASVCHSDNSFTSNLHEAASSGNVNLVKCLVENHRHQKQQFVNCRDKFKTTPLHIAALKGFHDIAALLVSYGANVNAVDDAGDSVLHKASKHGNIYLIRCLLNHKADPNSSNHLKQTPLHVAAQEGHIEIVEQLRNGGAELGSVNAHKQTVLHAAAKSGHVELVKYLINQLLDAPDDELVTPILHAALKDHKEIFKIFMSYGASPYRINRFTGTCIGQYEINATCTNIVFDPIDGRNFKAKILNRAGSQSDDGDSSC